MENVLIRFNNKKTKTTTTVTTVFSFTITKLQMQLTARYVGKSFSLYVTANRGCGLKNKECQGGLARSSRLKERSMKHDIIPFLLLANDSFILLNAEFNDKHPTKKQTTTLYKLGNFNSRADNFVCSLTFILT
jgi:hypothetical protein